MAHIGDAVVTGHFEEIEGKHISPCASSSRARKRWEGALASGMDRGMRISSTSSMNWSPQWHNAT
jgi:hypothetical protein